MKVEKGQPHTILSFPTIMICIAGIKISSVEVFQKF